MNNLPTEIQSSCRLIADVVITHNTSQIGSTIDQNLKLLKIFGGN